jgi:hypothetical protein
MARLKNPKNEVKRSAVSSQLSALLKGVFQAVFG